jgi:single-stranded-DNA-specific exonuclease
VIKINNTSIAVPMPELKFRTRHDGVFKAMKERGCSNITSIIAANRVSDVSAKTYQDLFNPSIAKMDLWKLKDIEIASERIYQAKINKEYVALVTDFDVDGISSAVVMKRALCEIMGFEDERVKICVNFRMQTGYGFTIPAMEEMFSKFGEDTPPTLVITADQGSNDSPTIRVYKDIMRERGFPHSDAIVTDHHHISEGNTCSEAKAFINPQRPDDDFEDDTICGCMVALLVMSAARSHMVENGDLPEDTPSIKGLLTYACLATVADCVSLKSGINRFVIRSGLKAINQGLLPAWTVLKRKVNKPDAAINAQDLAFKLGPAINADSRTGGDGSNAINFLMAKTVEDANFYFEKLGVKNNRRKEVETSMLEFALEDASRQYYDKNMRGISVYLPDGSHGIHGIVATRIKDRFNCPVIIFSPSNRDDKNSPERVISGSGRCVEHLSIVDMVQKEVGQTVPLLKSGGHPAAMGMSIKLKHFDEFQEKFDLFVKENAKSFGLEDDFFYPRVMVDHLIKDGSLRTLQGLKILEEIHKLEPYGQRFEAPIFGINGTFLSASKTRSGEHMKVYFKDSIGFSHEAMCFFYEREPWLEILEVGQEYTFAVTLNYSAYSKTGLGMIVEGVAEGINAISR